MFQNVADVRVASEVPEMTAVRPRLIDDNGGPKRTTIKAEAYPALRERVDRMGSVDPAEDNMLLISSDARKASLDLRMVDPAVERNPNGKVQLAAAKVAEIYRDEESNKGAQLVFLDMGTPKAKAKVTEDEDSDAEQSAEELTGAESGCVRDLYGILKRELIARGVDESEIAFVQEYPPKARAALFEKVNSGDIRIVPQFDLILVSTRLAFSASSTKSSIHSRSYSCLVSPALTAGVVLILECFRQKLGTLGNQGLDESAVFKLRHYRHPGRLRRFGTV